MESPAPPSHVAASVEVHTAVRDSRRDSRHSGAGLAWQDDRRRGDLLRRLSVDHRHRPGDIRVQPARVGRRASAAVPQRRRVADSGRAVLPSAFGRRSVLLLAIWIGVGFIFRGVATTVSAISDPTLPGRGWEIFFGVITMIAGVIVLASPFESIATLDLRRRHLAHSHRRVRGGVGVRHPQSGQGNQGAGPKRPR